ncbi:hypothetical protein BGX27_010632 [Mortierella sp. AM989]|nr:hypothetical protein BGX27_010632 [Mortierella sp. AM989]
MEIVQNQQPTAAQVADAIRARLLSITTDAPSEVRAALAAKSTVTSPVKRKADDNDDDQDEGGKPRRHIAQRLKSGQKDHCNDTHDDKDEDDMQNSSGSTPFTAET